MSIKLAIAVVFGYLPIRNPQERDRVSEFLLYHCTKLIKDKSLMSTNRKREMMVMVMTTMTRLL